jgi:hypothetical protein
MNAITCCTVELAQQWEQWLLDDRCFRNFRNVSSCNFGWFLQSNPSPKWRLSVGADFLLRLTDGVECHQPVHCWRLPLCSHIWAARRCNHGTEIHSETCALIHEMWSLYPIDILFANVSQSSHAHRHMGRRVQPPAHWRPFSPVISSLLKSPRLIILTSPRSDLLRILSANHRLPSLISRKRAEAVVYRWVHVARATVFHSALKPYIYANVTDLSTANIAAVITKIVVRLLTSSHAQFDVSVIKDDACRFWLSR